jgi:tetratricopeptide (TPR) repeat protein
MDSYVEEKLASKHEELADIYFQYKFFAESLDQLFRAQKLSTRKAEITMRIAECFVKMGDGDRAIRELKTLIREYPHFIPARLKLGVIYYNMNNLAEATEQWENILLRDPRHPEALKHLKMTNSVGLTTLNL